jgi:hypothetical protein
MSPYLNAPTVSTVWYFLALGRERKKKSSSEEVRKGGTRSALFFFRWAREKIQKFFF